MIIVGIDPGKHTGLAAWDVTLQQLLEVKSLLIHQAMRQVLSVRPALVIFEDARQRGWLGPDKGRAQLQGAGSIKRDSTIWEDFLIDERLPYIAHRPSVGATKWKTEQFARMTKWCKPTNEHARDAAMLIWQLNRPMVEGMIRIHAAA